MREGFVELKEISTLSDPYEKTSRFYGFLVRELEICRTFLDEREATNLAVYYGHLHKQCEDRRNYFIYRHSQRVQHLVKNVKTENRVLDVGCGLGSESILCGILGSRVTGVDLIEADLQVAKKRLKFYETSINNTLAVDFRAQSIFDVADSFDVIWLLESISHVEPADKFIAFARDHLNNKGKLIISDPNKLNPLIFYRTWKARGRLGGPVLLVKNPYTGATVPWANERVFDPCSIRKLLLQNGFLIESFSYSGLLPYMAHFSLQHKNLALYFEDIFRPVWPKWLSGIYTLVAHKG